MYLLITESPAKAKKIQGFLSNQYTVKSSCGHIVDLEKKKLSIDVDNDFKPTYKVTSDKRDVVKQLKIYSKGKKVILAADDDREGEAIAWHCANVLKVNIEEKNRIVFREISKKAILQALQEPKKIDICAVNAQQARRIIDRLIGFKLSPCLWKHIKCQETGLSAGRVQSALLNLIDVREQYIEDYEPDISLDIKGQFIDLKDADFVFTKEYNIDTTFITTLFTLFSKERIFTVTESSVSKDKVHPPKPFITSSLQQSALNELGMSVSKTMMLAQKLYEGGHITYMRTDSTFISEEFQDKMKTHIDNEYSQGYYRVPSLKKVKGAQEAHEAIRPMELRGLPELEQDETRLYNLIMKRTITSHMKPAEYDIYKIKLCNSLIEDTGYFTTKYRQLQYPGFMKYTKKDHVIEDKPNFKETYKLLTSYSSEKEEVKPAYYNESMIVNLLEETGIGRPSTYASIMSTLGNRKYTTRENITADDREEIRIDLHEDDTIVNTTNRVPGKVMKNRIMITPLGKKVLVYLREHFHTILDKNFTSGVEKDLDLISEGTLDWIEVIRKVYTCFIDIVDKQMNIKLTSCLQILGEKQGKVISLGNGRYGPYLQIELKDKPKKVNKSIQKYLELIEKDETNLTFEDALQFLKYPKNINKDISIHIGPHGYYMKSNGKNYSIKQDGDYTEAYCLQQLR